MADWFTPIQRLKAKETTWMKLEKSNEPLEDIPEQERLYYYGKRQHAKCKFEYDLFFDTSGILDPKSKKDTAISQEQILNNIYREEMSRRVPLVTSHLYGHWLENIEGRPLGNHKKVENKSDYRRTGLPLDKTIGLPKATNALFLE